MRYKKSQLVTLSRIYNIEYYRLNKIELAELLTDEHEKRMAKCWIDIANVHPKEIKNVCC